MLGVCHVAVVELVAVRTCPVVGAVALDTFISVVADFKRLAVMVLVAPVIVLFVRVATALFFVASLVLSTFHNPTSHFTIPVGVVIFGLVQNTKAPLHVSSLITHFSCADVVDAN